MAKIDISVENLANTINKLSKQDIETLLIILNKDGNDLIDRINDVKNKKVKTLSKEEIFGV